MDQWSNLTFGEMEILLQLRTPRPIGSCVDMCIGSGLGWRDTRCLIPQAINYLFSSSIASRVTGTVLWCMSRVSSELASYFLSVIHHQHPQRGPQIAPPFPFCMTLSALSCAPPLFYMFLSAPLAISLSRCLFPGGGTEMQDRSRCGMSVPSQLRLKVPVAP